MARIFSNLYWYQVAVLVIGSLGFLSLEACAKPGQKLPVISPSVAPTDKVFIGTFNFQDNDVLAGNAIMTFGTAKVPKPMGRDFVFQLVGEEGTVLEEYGIPDPLARQRCPEMEGSGIPEDVLAERCDPKKKEEIINSGKALYKASYSVKFPFHKTASTIRVLDATGKVILDAKGNPVAINLNMKKVVEYFCTKHGGEPECSVRKGTEASDLSE